MLFVARFTDKPGIAEKRMFGGLVFMLDGHMLCGVMRDGGMFRVGKSREAAAMAIDGAGVYAGAQATPRRPSPSVATPRCWATRPPVAG